VLAGTRRRWGLAALEAPQKFATWKQKAVARAPILGSSGASTKRLSRMEPRSWDGCDWPVCAFRCASRIAFSGVSPRRARLSAGKTLPPSACDAQHGPGRAWTARPAGPLALPGIPPGQTRPSGSGLQSTPVVASRRRSARGKRLAGQIAVCSASTIGRPTSLVISRGVRHGSMQAAEGRDRDQSGSRRGAGSESVLARSRCPGGTRPSPAVSRDAPKRGASTPPRASAEVQAGSAGPGPT